MSQDLRAVREVWAGRAGARTRTDLLYLLYLVALSVPVLLVPALQSVGMLLARPDVLPALLSARSPQVIGAAVAAGAAALVLCGAVRGPALLAPFLTATLASSGLRRRDVLWRPLLRALLVPVLGSALGCAVLALALGTAGHATPAAGAWFVLAGTGAGLLLGAAWLSGQLLDPALRRLLAVALLALAVLQAAMPPPTGLGAAYPVGAPHPGLWAGALFAAGAAAIAVGIARLDRLRGQVLREQAARWEAAGRTALAGDLSAAAGAFRPPPSAGRRLRAIGARPLVLLYARRDAVAWLRSPERLAAGTAAGLAGAAALAGSTVLTGPLAWAAVLGGTLTLWGASGSLVDGLRHGVHTLGAPGLFGQRAGAQVMLHALAPTVLLALLGALGGGLAAALARTGPAAAMLPMLLAPVLVAGRARDSAKGPMPLSLSTPMPTAQGDLSVLAMLAWQSDAMLLAALSGVVLAGLGSAGPLGLLPGAAALTAAMALMAARRLRALAR